MATTHPVTGGADPRRASAIYRIPDHHPLLEISSLQGMGPYGGAKVLAERVCGEYRRRCMCLPILRSKAFVGPERLGDESQRLNLDAA
jgi:nucleoside-diphosphate-sugar epimerase